MKLNRIYQILIGDKIVSVSSNLANILKELDEIRKSEPSAHIITCYA